MNIIKYQIWEEEWDNREDGFGYIYTADKIENAVDLSDQSFYKTGLDPREYDAESLNSKLAEFNKKDFNIYDTKEMLTEFFISIGIVADITDCADYEELKEEIIYDWNNEEFTNLGNFDEIKYISYLDSGTNFQKHINNSYNTIITELTVNTDEEKCLDKWDGRNMVTGGVGLHEYINIITELDGENITDTYLIHRASQWQGERDTAKVMTKDEVIEYLKEIGRDPEDYI